MARASVGANNMLSHELGGGGGATNVRDNKIFVHEGEGNSSDPEFHTPLLTCNFVR